ncbi:MAG: hypothetical protein AABX99_01700 [Nanoarchaeota archaeon]
MELSSLILQNKWVLEIFYALLISSVCLIIFAKADKFFRLSSHQGIRYFRNAFFFYGIAFLVRYLYGVFSDFSFSYSEVFRVSFEYFLIMAGFFLLYSLVWKKFEFSEKDSSMFNGRIMVFHAIALVVAILDNLWGTYYFMFASQIIVFMCASLIACVNSIRNGKTHKFLGSYFVAMLLGLTAWILNFLVALFFNWRHFVLLDIGIINAIFFILFLYGVIKITKNGSKKT